MSFHGNIGEIDRIAKGLDKGLLMNTIAQRAKDAIVKQVSTDVAAEQDPYGVPWAPRVDGEPLATDLTMYLRAKASAESITLYTTGPQGQFRTGTSHMVARPLLPFDPQGIPDSWIEALDAAVAEAVGDRIKPTAKRSSPRAPTFLARVKRVVKRTVRKVFR